MERTNVLHEKLMAIADEPSIAVAPAVKELCKEAADVIARLSKELQRKTELQSEPMCSLKELERAERQRDEAYAAIRSIEHCTNYPLENRPCKVCRYIGLYCSSGGSSCRGFKWVGFSSDKGGCR